MKRLLACVDDRVRLHTTAIQQEVACASSENGRLGAQLCPSQIVVQHTASANGNDTNNLMGPHASRCCIGFATFIAFCSSYIHVVVTQRLIKFGQAPGPISYYYTYRVSPESFRVLAYATPQAAAPPTQHSTSVAADSCPSSNSRSTSMRASPGRVLPLSICARFPDMQVLNSAPLEASASYLSSRDRLLPSLQITSTRKSYC